MNLEPTRSESKYAIWIVLLAIIASWAMYWLWVAPLVSDNKFDPLNTLFSGLAFWGVIYAILLQRNELALQRKELELTRQELRGQKEQLESQNITLKQQRFENTFFSLVNLFNSIVASMEVKTDTATSRPQTFTGRECFIPLYNDFQREYSGQENQTPNGKPPGIVLSCL